ncbi:MAG: tandem-95 repeat protein [Thalassolituus maritimus]|nr:MAG: tandem-95 repeat protein [Thalassolituus maritimus]
MPNARLAPAILISLSLILQGCFFEQDPLPETQEEKQSDLIAEAADDGGSAAAPNANGEASVTDLETGLSVSVSKDALSGLAAGDNFVLQVTPLNENEVPAGSSAIQIAGQVFNIKIRSVNTGEELQPTGGMKVTLPYGSTINGTDIQKLAIANYHDNEWVIFAADSIDDVKKTVTATITQLSPVAVVKNNAINSAPVAPDYTGTILEDGTYSLKINATDADGDGLVYSWLDDTTGEKVADNASLDAAGNFSYQPLENFNGQTVLQYKVSDGELSDTGSITITVEGVNDAPVAADYTATIAEDGTYNVVLQATDIDSNALTYSWLDGTTGEKVADNASLDAAGNFIYQPLENFNGQTVLQYKVSDGQFTDTGSITITVEGVNDAPVAGDYTGTIIEGTPIYGVKLSATDIDGDALTYSWLDGTTGGKPAYNAGLDAAGNFNYQPPENYFGINVFHYKVSDGELTDTGTITVTVTGVNDAPVAMSSSLNVTGNAGSQGTLSATDVDGDTYFTYAIVSQPEHGTVTISGSTFTYIPDGNYEGEDSFEFTANDGALDSASPGATTNDS